MGADQGPAIGVANHTKASRTLGYASLNKNGHSMACDNKSVSCLTCATSKAFGHLLHQCRKHLENPRYFHTYADEDSMKWCKSFLVKNCVLGKAGDG